MKHKRDKKRIKATLNPGYYKEEKDIAKDPGEQLMHENLKSKVKQGLDPEELSEITNMGSKKKPKNKIEVSDRKLYAKGRSWHQKSQRKNISS